MKGDPICSTPEEDDGRKKSRAMIFGPGGHRSKAAVGVRVARSDVHEVVEPTTWALGRHGLAEPPNRFHAITLAWARKIAKEG